MKRTYKAVPSSIVASSYQEPQFSSSMTFDEWMSISNPVHKLVAMEKISDLDTLVQIFEYLSNREERVLLNSFLSNPYLPEDLRSDCQERVDELFARAYEQSGIEDSDAYDAESRSRDADNIDWPDPERFNMIYDDEDMEDIWSTYLCGPEDEVQKELQVFFEPSVQGGVGGMFIFDESEEDRFDPIEVDFSEWESNELDMAAASNSPGEYKQKFKEYIESLIH